MAKEPKYSIENLEIRDVMAASVFSWAGFNLASFYSADGSGNNLAYTDWGSAGIDLLRTAAADYGDGLSAPAGDDRPSAREISNALSAQSEDIISDRALSAMIYAWGQFIDHDIDLTPSGYAEYFPIAIPEGDPSFDPFGSGTETMPFGRSLYDPETGTTAPREQINVVTAFLDGSMIYGSSEAVAGALRTFTGGRLKMSANGYLPWNDRSYFPEGTLSMANDAHVVADNELFAAGDVRANENIELTALQTLFVREHNRLADAIAAANPHYSDEQTYQLARAWVIGEIQVITYREWLPTLLGQGAVSRYEGYDPSVNPGIANEFSTAAFRLGHSLLGDDVEFLGNNGLPIAEEVALSEAFFNPPLLTANGIDSILKYLASDPASEIDTKVVESVRDFLFGPPGSGGLDLASLNIQRGRDHGLADYNSIREAYGLERVTSFAEITSDVELQRTLEELFGTVDNIDAWVGMLAEDHVRGSSVGETLREVISDQFERLRDGDRLWYQQVFSGNALRELEKTSLVDIIRRNTTLTNLQSNAFLFQAGISGTVFTDSNGNGVLSRGEHAQAGKRIELVDAGSGEILAVTTTDRQGHYAFDIADGIRTGLYQLRLSTPGTNGTTVLTRMIAITRVTSSCAWISASFLPGTNRGMDRIQAVSPELTCRSCPRRVPPLPDRVPPSLAKPRRNRRQWRLPWRPQLARQRPCRTHGRSGAWEESIRCRYAIP